MNTKSNLLFVYGTLKGKNDIPGLKYLGKAETIGKYILYDGGFPSVRPYESVHKQALGHVRGEVYEITNAAIWDGYDDYEGHPDFFERKVIGVFLGNEPLEAWMYFGPVNTAGTRTPKDPDSDGIVHWPYTGEHP